MSATSRQSLVKLSSGPFSYEIYGFPKVLSLVKALVPFFNFFLRFLFTRACRTCVLFSEVCFMLAGKKT